MAYRASAVRALAALVSIAGLVTGCGSGESGSSETASSSSAVEGEPASAIPAVFEGLDPCTLVTAEEARNAIGAPSVGPPKRTVAPGQTGAMAGCSWQPPHDVGVHLTFTAPPTLPATDHAETWSRELGHPAEARTTSGSCFVYVWYSNDRMVDLRISPPAPQRATSLEDDVCTRSTPFIKQVFAKIPWK